MALNVVGLGSELSGDDAVGLVLVERLSGRLAGTPVSCLLWSDVDALTAAHDLLALEGAVLLVDCADMGLEPGSYRLLAQSGVRLQVKHSAVSVHGIGVAEALELARRLGFVQPLHLFAVQPFQLEPGTSLSNELQARLPALEDALAAAVEGLESSALPGGSQRRIG
jgi:hydrogenase maturation protease